MSEQRRRTELRQRLLEDYPTLPAAVVLAAVTEAERAVTLFAGNSANNSLEQAIRHNLTAVLAVFHSTGRTPPVTSGLEAVLTAASEKEVGVRTRSLAPSTARRGS